MFLLTDAQVPDEKFLVLINDLLASGEIPDLFAGIPLYLSTTVDYSNSNCRLTFLEKLQELLGDKYMYMDFDSLNYL